MNRETLEALQASIAAWEHKLTIDDPREIDIGASACPLCAMFDPDDDANHDPCDGCPVSSDTGMTGCQGSPYIKARDAIVFWRSGVRQRLSNIEDRKDDARARIQEEIDYLKSLLP